MKSLTRLFAIIILATLIASCGTIKTWNLGNSENKEGPISARELSFRNLNYECNNPTESLYIPYVYSGVKSDFLHITWASKCGWASGETGLFNNAFYVLSIPFVIIDVPLSFVADTVLLPLTISKQKKDGNLIDPPYFKMGNYQRSLGNNSKAIDFYEKGFKILSKYYGTMSYYDIRPYLPEFEETLLILAKKYEQNGEYIKAISYYENLAEIALRSKNGDLEKYYNDLARTFSNAGNQEKANEYAHKYKAQETVNFNGKVVDAETELPIEGALLVAIGRGKGYTPKVNTVVEGISDNTGIVTLNGTFPMLDNPPSVIIYKKGYLVQSSYRSMADIYKQLTDFKWQNGYIFKLNKWGDKRTPPKPIEDHFGFIYGTAHYAEQEGKPLLMNSILWEKK